MKLDDLLKAKTVLGDEDDSPDTDRINEKRFLHGRMYFEDEKVEKELLPFYTPPTGQNFNQHQFKSNTSSRDKSGLSQVPSTVSLKQQALHGKPNRN